MRMRTKSVVSETPQGFIEDVKQRTLIERKPLQFCHERLSSLIRTLELTDLDEFSNLEKVTGFATLAATYRQGILSPSSFLHFPSNQPFRQYKTIQKGFLLIFEPYDSRTPNIPDPIFHLWLLI